MRKAAIAWRWYGLVCKFEDKMTPLKRVLFGALHRAGRDYEYEEAYDALKELRDKNREIKQSAARIAELEAALGMAQRLIDAIDRHTEYCIICETAGGHQSSCAFMLTEHAIIAALKSTP